MLADEIFIIAFEEFSNGNHQQAIEAFSKSLALHEDWESYQGLGMYACRHFLFAFQE